MQYDEKGNAAHYSGDRIQNIERMERIWGTRDLMIFCEITEFKYRSRIGKKPGQPLEQEVVKMEWYANKAKELQSKIGTPFEIIIDEPSQKKFENN